MSALHRRTNPIGPSLSRRGLLTAGAGLAATLGAGSLAGCSSSSSRSTNNATSNAAVVLPTYVPAAGAKPDLAATADGVEAGYYSFPSDRPKSVSEKPGTGGQKLTGMANIYVPAPPGPSQNTWWAGLNDRLGVDLDMIMVPNADYTAKFATTIAGSQLPDMLQMQVVANFPQLLDKQFTVLDEYLSGDAVKDYPNLANVPTFTWRNTVYNGHIYGIPIPRGRVGSYDLIRPDAFERAGVSAEIKGWDQLQSTAQALTSAKDRRWAFTRAGDAFSIVRRMNECANDWVAEGTQLTTMYSTDAYRQSLQDMITLWKAGVIHPDGFNTQQPFKQLFSAGNTAIVVDGYLAWPGYVIANKTDSSFRQGLMTLTTRDGSKPAPFYPGTGYYSINSLAKQSDPEKIKLALRVCNYLAAPFATEESFYLSYGDQQTDYTLVDGQPVLTDKGTTDIALPVGYLGAAPHALYQPNRPDDVKVQHAYMAQVLPRSLVNPTLGLFSNTAATKAATANTALTDGINDIIQGRKPYSDYDGLVTTWKSAAGDAMRDEFAGQLASQPTPTSSPT